MRLFERWCRTAERDNGMRQRMKMMAFLSNHSELKVNSLVRKFNGKPMLCTKSSSLHRGPGNSYLELGINGFIFGMLARKGLSMMLDKVPKMVLQIGFTVEGRTDEELPECLVSGAHMPIFTALTPMAASPLCPPPHPDSQSPPYTLRPLWLVTN